MADVTVKHPDKVNGPQQAWGDQLRGQHHEVQSGGLDPFGRPRGRRSSQCRHLTNSPWASATDTARAQRALAVTGFFAMSLGAPQSTATFITRIKWPCSPTN